MDAGTLSPVDCYEIWCDLINGSDDLAFVDAVRDYLAPFVERGDLTRYRVRRRKLGFGPEFLGEFCLTLEFENLASIDKVFNQVAERGGSVEQSHHKVYSLVKNFRSALYRDFPDAVRVRS